MAKDSQVAKKEALEEETRLWRRHERIISVVSGVILLDI